MSDLDMITMGGMSLGELRAASQEQTPAPSETVDAVSIPADSIHVVTGAASSPLEVAPRELIAGELIGDGESSDEVKALYVSLDYATDQLSKCRAEVSRLSEENERLRRDAERLDWWFAHGMEDSVCEGSVDLWWADDKTEKVQVTHGTSVRDAIDRAMRGIYELGE